MLKIHLPARTLTLVGLISIVSTTHGRRRLIPVALLVVLALLASQAAASGPTFAPTGSLGVARYGHIAIQLPGGKILVAGGQDSSAAGLSSAEIFDPATGSWTPAGSMTFPRFGHAAVLLPNGKVLVVGGTPNNPVCTGPPVGNSAEIFDPATGSWTLTATMNVARNSPAAVLLADGRVLVAGGGNRCGGVFNSAEIFDPTTGIWTVTAGMNVARQEPAGLTLPNGKVLVAGGSGGNPFPSLASAEIFDATLATWTLTGSMQNPRIWGGDDDSAPDGLIPLPNGSVFTAGGMNRPCYGCQPLIALAAAELFNPTAGVWTATGNMNSARLYPRSTLLATGQVLVTGGESLVAVLSSAELFDPVAGTFSPAGNMTTPRVVQSATLLADGRVLVAGGYLNGALDSAEIWGSVGDTTPPVTWIQEAPSGPLPPARSGHSAVFDASTNQMIVFGGTAVASDVPTTLNDLWRLSDANGSGGQAWTQVSAAGAPAARTSHSAVYSASTNRMVIFGGGLGNTSPCVNDSWVLTNANGNGGSPSWIQLSPSGPAPPVRTNHVAAYDQTNNRMLVFGGGNCFPSGLYNDVWVLVNADGTGGTPAWVQLSPTGTPPPPTDAARGFYDSANNRLVIFGGNPNNDNNPPVNDVYVLTNANGLGGTPAWIKLSPSGSLPPGRANHSVVYDSSTDRMIIFGGIPATYPSLNDTWVLTSANGLGGTPTWTELFPTGGLPPVRHEHTAVYDSATNRMVIFGGETMNDVWVLSNANGLLTPTVTFTGAPASAIVGTSFNVAATTNASTTPSITATGACSIAGNTVTMTSGTGTCLLTASWAADQNYSAASATQSTVAQPIPVTLSPSPRTFPDQGLLSPSAPSAVTVRNNQSTTLTFSGITIAGANPGDFTQSATTCGATLAAQATCTISIQFVPQATGSRAATLTISDNAGNSPQTVALTGTGVLQVVVTPATLGFGSQGLGSPTTAKTVTVNSNISSTLTFTSIAITGANPGDFTQSATTCGATLAAQATCTISIQFVPQATGPRAATLTISDDAGNSPQTVALTGTGVLQVVVTPATLGFGSQGLGSPTAPKTVTVNSNISSTLTFTSFAIAGANPGDFTQSATTCGATLAAQATCTISIQFVPQATGSRAATLTISDNAGNSPQTVALTGTGVLQVVVTPATLGFGSQGLGSPTAPKTVTVNSNISSTLTFTSFAIAGANPGDFTQSATTCGATLAAQATCTISIQFVPQATGSRAATLTISDNAGNSPQTVALTGTGVLQVVV